MAILRPEALSSTKRKSSGPTSSGGRAVWWTLRRLSRKPIALSVFSSIAAGSYFNLCQYGQQSHRQSHLARAPHQRLIVLFVGQVKPPRAPQTGVSILHWNV